MPVPIEVTRFNKAVANKVLIRFAGRGPLVELEHVGRRTGRAYRTPLMAFRHGNTITFALTYGPRVDWFRNVKAVGGCRLRMGTSILTLGAPSPLPTQVGLDRMPSPARVLLPRLGVTDFVELPILAAYSSVE